MARVVKGTARAVSDGFCPNRCSTVAWRNRSTELYTAPRAEKLQIAMIGVILALVGSAFAALPAYCTGTERDALVAIYTATNGPAWTKPNNWNTDAHYCSWTGVTCNSAAAVISLDLSEMGMSNALPQEIGCLQFLKTLYVNENPNMVSSIPEAICALENLQYLQMINAGLSGDIPTCLCNLAFAQYIYLSNNRLTGTIPACFGSMQFLRELHLDCNTLTGDVPLALFNAPMLEELRVQCNADLVCTEKPADSRVIYECGMDNCEDCNITPINCPDCIDVPDCGRYCQVVTNETRASK